MKSRRFVLLLSLFSSTAPAPLPATPAASAAEAAAEPVSLSREARQDVVAKLGAALRERYVFPEVGERAAARLETALAAGDYAALTDPAAFAARLSTDVGAIAHDKHLRIWSDAAPPPPPAAAGGPPPAAEAGIVRADRLAGDIGYVEIVGFPPPEMFKPVIDRAMAGLAGSRALIVDIRRNGGGSPESVAYLVSFLVAPDRPINDIVSRVEKTKNFTRQSYRSVATPVGFAETPVYVLTSKQTFSGGEEFAYDVQALKRGRLIGEVTGGGANPTRFIDLGHGVGATIPFGRAENPATKSNWEGRGVLPDVKVPSGSALATALKLAGQKPVEEIAAASLRQTFAPRSTPLPGSEAALRGVIAGYASGKPDYAAMAPELAEMIRGGLADLQAQFAPLGALRSMAFHGPDMIGGDEYLLHFANGDRLMALLLGPDGKILAVSTPMPVPAAN